MIMKKLITGLLMVGTIGLLAGCGQQSSLTNHRNPATQSSTSDGNQASNSSSANGTQSSDHHSSALWNGSKDRQLEEFINSWAPKMHQSYEKYDGSNELSTSVGCDYPSTLSQEATPDGGSIGWAPSGKGPYDYNVVAIYNYNKPTGGQVGRITYFFAFHNGQPVALVDETNNGTPTCKPTANVDVSSNFTRIANEN